MFRVAVTLNWVHLSGRRGEPAPQGYLMPTCLVTPDGICPHHLLNGRLSILQTTGSQCKQKAWLLLLQPDRGCRALSTQAHTPRQGGVAQNTPYWGSGDTGPHPGSLNSLCDLRSTFLSTSLRSPL